MKFKILHFFILVFTLSSCISSPKHPEVYTLIVGTSSTDHNGGIYTYYFDDGSARFKICDTVSVANPTFMDFDIKNNLVFSVSEGDSLNSAVYSYKYNLENNSLTEITKQPCFSDFPCYILKGNGWIATANYGGGNISVFPVNKNGKIGSIRQQIEMNDSSKIASHMHCLVLSPDKKHLFATDLGKDSIYRFEISSRQAIKDGNSILKQIYPSVSIKTGSGPRHLTFAPNQRHAYLINELSGTVIGFNYKNGTLKKFQTILSDSVGGGGSADIHLSSDGKFLYSSNRLKADGISIFAVDQNDGKLTKIGYTNTGIHPRNITLSPNDNYLLVACRDSDAVQIFSRDKKTGLLKYLKEFKVESPMFVHFM